MVSGGSGVRQSARESLSATRELSNTQRDEMSAPARENKKGPVTQFLQYKDFAASLQSLMSKGGKFQKAGTTVLSILGKVSSGTAKTVDEAFAGVTLTNHGESRIAHCRKYDLTGYARLVTAFSNGVCMFLFAGDHDATDKWLDGNRGLDFIAHEVNGRQEIRQVFISDQAPGKQGIIASSTDWLQSEPLLELLPLERRQKLLDGIPEQVLLTLSSIYSYTEEDDILGALGRVPNQAQADSILDVMLLLRSGNRVAAHNRIDLYIDQAKPVSELSQAEVQSIVSSETAVLTSDVDPVLFEHFVRTASFKDWMLYLHPSQRAIVDKDYAGPVRLAGVSGSGKTAVVIHRAMRLARANPSARVLVLTLNHALAKLIQELVRSSLASSQRLDNLTITSVFELCNQQLKLLEPDKKDYYRTRTVPSKYVEAEHIDDIWKEYFTCETNNKEADVMFDVVRTLLVRNIHPQEYLRQEFNYIRSAFAKSERNRYLEMDRVGRAIPLERRYREMVQAGLEGWERKMGVVGAVDDLGVTEALYKHFASLGADFDHVLVDEVQDLGTLELRIIRALTKQGPNDLFLAGDAVQAVHTKFCDVKAAGIDLPPARWIRLRQNYRNSRQILTAAYAVLQSNLERVPPALSDLEVLVPEFANFSSAKPLLLKVNSVEDELTYALGYCKQSDNMLGSDSKACIAICGMTQKAVEELGKDLGIDVLSDSTDLSGARLFISDLEQTKGFEFDLMFVINCAYGVIPQSHLPERESFRELCKLYVAMTRAKRELVMSYTGSSSTFLVGAEEHFSVGSWGEHEVVPAEVTVRSQAGLKRDDQPHEKWLTTGRDFLKTRDAVGLTVAAQDAILAAVTGRSLVRREAGRPKEVEWPHFDAFFRTMASDPRARINIVSKEVWEELESNFRSSLPAPASEVAAPKPSADPRPVSRRPVASSDGSNETAQEIKKTFTVFFNRSAKGYQGETLITYLLAVMMVATNSDRIAELQVGVPIRRDLLEYLLPKHIITHWQSKGWLRELRTDPTRLVLTKSGVDVCRGWIGLGPWRPQQGAGPLSEQRIESFRGTILRGPELRESDQFERKSFA
ncbi:MAG: hypothetical protein EON58_01440 [Alphaproteobacteria bacterium]|nr:MAG: hypothetical protein EON58_01440 [Alphaproteobacteria bacterium]